MPRQRYSDRIRSPKVHITYESETGPRQELPFVVGVIGDFSGDPAAPLERLSEREFTPVKHDDLDDKMGRQMKPGLRLRVKDALKADGSEMMIELKFRRMEDFEPSGIVRQAASMIVLSIAFPSVILAAVPGQPQCCRKVRLHSACRQSA